MFKYNKILSEEKMLDFATEYFKTLKGGDVVFLSGELGAGKTTFVRNLLNSLNYHGKVKSPTYTLVESYDINNIKIHHFDLYRLADPEELEWMGIREYFDENSIVFIEWAEKGQGYLPKPTKQINISYIEGNLTSRKIYFN